MNLTTCLFHYNSSFNHIFMKIKPVSKNVDITQHALFLHHKRERIVVMKLVLVTYLCLNSITGH